jgi:predicted unusual protein kinase regulating ubiquinone biosynthesis (AarF/ABC1/UbiB family)
VVRTPLRLIRILTALLLLARGGLLARIRRSRSDEIARRTARQLRSVLESLGGTWLKVGQLLAMRPDVVDQRYVDELQHLLDKVAPFEGELAARIIEEELGKPIGETFAEFDSTPVAAASFAQVHRARLTNGEQVAVKVQRPGLDMMVRSDIQILRGIARVVDWLGLLNRVQAMPIINDFAQWTQEELDFTTEAAYAERLRRGTTEMSKAHIPVIHWDQTTRRVLTMEYLNGIWISDLLVDLQSDGPRHHLKVGSELISLRDIGDNIFKSLMDQVFRQGTFHADPHAGNIIVLESGDIGFVDFGIVGSLDTEFRRTQLALLTALHEEDLDAFAQNILRLMKPAPADVDLDGFLAEVKQNARNWENSFYNKRADLGDRSSGAVFAANVRSARAYGLSFSDVAVRYYRAFTVAEIIVLRLNPAFDVRMSIRSFLTNVAIREARKSATPDVLVRRLLSLGLVAQQFPSASLTAMEHLGYEARPTRTAVSRFQLTASKLFKGFAVATCAAVVAMPIASTMVASFGRIGPLNWQVVALLTAVLSLLFAWLARQLYVNAPIAGTIVRQGTR